MQDANKKETVIYKDTVSAARTHTASRAQGLPDFLALLREHLHQVGDGVLRFGRTQSVACGNAKNTGECGFILKFLSGWKHFYAQIKQSMNRTKNESKLIIWNF